MLVTLVLILGIAWGSLAAMLAAGWEAKLGLDLQGGFAVVLVSPEGTSKGTLETAVEVMRRRIEGLGSVQEPEISVQGDRSIVVQLPGVEDRERALRAVGTTGEMSFRAVIDIVPQSPYFSDPDGDHPPNINPETGLSDPDDVNEVGYLLAKESLGIYVVGPAFLTGVDMKGGQSQFSGQGGHGGQLGSGAWVVVPEFTSEGGEKFREATGVLATFPVNSAQRQLAIVVDGVVQSSPFVGEGVDPNEGLDPNQVVITIGASENPQGEADELAAILNYGALPTTFERERVESVSASLGEDSLRAGLIAGLIGLALVAAYMIFYYRVLGVVAIVGLSVFGAILVASIILLGQLQGTTLTLAGVTGIVVSIGITLDSSIVYFERIKEEVHDGRPLRATIDHAFPGAFSTNLKGDTVTLLAAVLLWLLAIGPVKGFALTLGLATVIDVVVAYFYTRPAVWLLGHSRLLDGGWFSMRGAMGKTDGQPQVDDLVEVSA
ncbi:MAG: protein translocase subunit SecD [Acidimicrobiia bacterium]|nr:MAG: protein translocase subunit SecD [Acidimicrobiia bacterium]